MYIYIYVYIAYIYTYVGMYVLKLSSWHTFAVKCNTPHYSCLPVCVSICSEAMSKVQLNQDGMCVFVCMHACNNET